MTYSGGRVILDADSHVMELADFLDEFLEPQDLARMRRTTMDALAPVLHEASERAERRRSDPEAAAAAEARLLQDKGWFAMGGFESSERSRVLDLLGFEGQLVFATFASTLYLGRDLGRLYAGAAAQNHALHAFCAERPAAAPRRVRPARRPRPRRRDARRGARGGVRRGDGPFDRRRRSVRRRTRTSTGSGGGSRRPTCPFVLHVGGGGRLLDPAFHDNARPVTDHLGGGENVRSKDYLAIHHSPEVFLGVLILDGLFDRFPRLRGGCIEQGAGWVVSWLRHLDHAQRAFRRTEAPLAELADQPSSYVRRHLKFTPFPGEPVGWMMEQAGAELFMFSTDYPHPEGGRDPLASFEAQLDGVAEGDLDRFYRANMAELLYGQHAEAAAAGA